MKEKGSVLVECGTIDASYKGVANPQLNAVYLQSAEEEARYAPIMRELMENGLEVTGEKISGI